MNIKNNKKEQKRKKCSISHAVDTQKILCDLTRG